MNTTTIDGQEYALMPLTPLSKGTFTILDLDVLELVKRWKWGCNNRGYAKRTFWLHGKRDVLYLHRFISKPPQGLITDHVNGNKLDNRRVNLRHATISENQRNRIVYRNNTLGIKCVWYDPSRCKFKSDIRVCGKTIFLGRFDTAELAQAAYNAASLKYHGEFASPSTGLILIATDP